MEFVLKIVSIILSCCILYTAYLARRVSGSWLLPACLHSVAWFIFTIIPLALLPWIPINPLAVGFILLSCIAFTLPVLTSQWKSIQTATGAEASDLYDRPFLKITFYAFATLTLAALMISSGAQGLTIGSLTSDFFRTSNSLIADRYNQSTTDTVFTQISNVASYVTVCLGGLIYPGYVKRSAKFRIVFLSMAPALIVMTVFGAKGMIFLCIALFYAGTLIRRMRSGDYRLIDRSTMVKATLAIIALLPFVTIAFVARGLYEPGGQSLNDGLFRYFVSYTSAHMYAFSDWFSWHIGMPSMQMYVEEEASGGFYTFMSIFQLLGSTREAPPGVYEEYFQYEWYLQSNIYTVFRGQITDYTLIGALIFSLAFGYLANYLFISMLKNRNATWSVAFYFIFCGYVYTSFIISVFIWNSMYLVFIIVSVVLIFNIEGQAASRRRRSVAYLD